MAQRYALFDGIVLRRNALPSGDVVVTLFSEHGKKQAIARKGKLPGGNLGKLSLFHDVTVQHYSRNLSSDDLSLITQVQLNGALPRLSEPGIYPYAHVLAELADKLATDVNVEGQLYSYFVSGLRGLAQHPDPERVALIMCWRLLAQSGLAPRLSRCARCGEADLSGASTFDVAAGGLTCTRCGSGLRLEATVQDDLLALHRQSVSIALERPFAARRGHWALLSRYLEYHVGKLQSLWLLPRSPIPTEPDPVPTEPEPGS